ncbi:MAG: endonuclease MutS2 [Nitrospirae bacterium]|nr:endonuclease MutS2 [Nitrospirota bacterium]
MTVVCRMAVDGSSLLQQAAQVLEWDRLLGVLAGQARSTMGAERCRALPPETELEAARTRLQETADMVSLREGEGNDPFPSLSFPDLREVLGRAAKGAALEAHELRDLSTALGLVAEVMRYLAQRRDQTPALCAVATPLEELRPLHHVKVSIDRCVDPEGNIRESATSDLRRLTHQTQDLKRQMRHRLEGILASTRYADVLQERYFAQREGRYVVPVKSEMRSKIPGIVHDVSASGATVFIEPRELVELNNSIKVAELEVEREVRRILQELSTEVAGHVPTLQNGLEVLATLDSIAAKAAFSHLVKGQAVSLNDRGRIALKQARHPLLVLAREKVVANDILLDETVRVLMISGPNTGGKTVTLKIVGLFALMVRAGLQLPCGPDSDMALFHKVYADIGDAQDLAKDLSSFSAHMTQMVRLIGEAAPSRIQGGDQPGPARTLVLLDEPVTSTDPAEGAALAEALLIRLAQLGMKVVATTHYNSLKALAQTTPGFMNASVEFDVSRLAPTYRLIMDMPGGSSAIDIAGRLGMDEGILDHALRLLRREDLVLEQMLGDLQGKQRRLGEDLARIETLKAETEQSAKQAAEIEERLRLSEREERKSVKKKLTEDILKARAEVQAVVESLKGERTLVKGKEAKQRLAEIEEEARARLVKPAETKPVDQLTAGDRVEIVGLGSTGTLLEAPQGKKRVRVRVGETDLSVALSGLIGLVGAGDEEKLPRPHPAQSDRLRHPVGPDGLGASMVLDVRGKTSEEAMEETVAALDRAALTGAPFLRIIHGHGTGRLKAVLRDYLKGSPYVATFRAGDRVEGGDGVTIVSLG